MKTQTSPSSIRPATDPFGSLTHLWQNQPYSSHPEQAGFESLLQDNPALELILNVGPCISWIWQVRTGKYIFMSANAGTKLGYTPDSFLKGGINYTKSLFHPADAVHVGRLMRQIWVFMLALPPQEREICQYSCDYRLHKADGSYVRLLEQSRVLQTDSYGNITHVFGVWMDISHWKRNEILTASILSSGNGHCLLCTSADLQLQSQGTISKREQEVIKLMAEGYNSKEIAGRLGVSFHTITTHRQNIREKTNSKNTGELIQYAIQNGII